MTAAATRTQHFESVFSQYSANILSYPVRQDLGAGRRPQMWTPEVTR